MREQCACGKGRHLPLSTLEMIVDHRVATLSHERGRCAGIVRATLRADPARSDLPGHAIDRRVGHAHVAGDRPSAFPRPHALQGNTALVLGELRLAPHVHATCDGCPAPLAGALVDALVLILG